MAKDSEDFKTLQKHAQRHIERLENERRLQSSSLKLYQRELQQLLEALRQPSPLENLKKKLGHYSTATYRRKLQIWKQFLRTAPSPWENYLDSLEAPKLRQKQPHFLTDGEAFRLEQACYRSKNSLRNRLLVKFGLELGLRLQEMLDLRFQNIQGEWLQLTRKGSKEQYLPLTPSLQTLISNWKKERKASLDDFIFPGRSPYRPMTARTAQLIIQKLGNEIQLRHSLHPHALRHSFATRMASQGASLLSLKAFLGHERITTTERYLHVTPQHLKESLKYLQPQ